MTVTINWEAVSLLTTLGLAWTAFLVGTIRWLIFREIHNMDSRVTQTAKDTEANEKALQLHKEEYLKFLGTLPLDYYRREDMIRFETLTHAKLDALAGELRNLECRKCKVNH